MKSLRPHFRFAAAVLIGSGALACTCAAYDVDAGHLWGTLLHVAGLPQRIPSRELVLTAGQELSVDGRAVTVRFLPAEAVTQRLAWSGIQLQDGWVAFQGQTLQSVTEEFNHHSARQLVIGDLAIRQLRIGGKFRVTDIDGFIAALRLTHGVKALAAPTEPGKPQSIILTGSGPGSADTEGP